VLNRCLEEGRKSYETFDHQAAHQERPLARSALVAAGVPILAGVAPLRGGDSADTKGPGLMGSPDLARGKGSKIALGAFPVFVATYLLRVRRQASALTLLCVLDHFGLYILAVQQECNGAV
jgi:hypothetical protein